MYLHKADNVSTKYRRRKNESKTWITNLYHPNEVDHISEHLKISNHVIHMS